MECGFFLGEDQGVSMDGVWGTKLILLLVIYYLLLYMIYWEVNLFYTWYYIILLFIKAFYLYSSSTKMYENIEKFRIINFTKFYPTKIYEKWHQNYDSTKNYEIKNVLYEIRNLHSTKNQYSNYVTIHVYCYDLLWGNRYQDSAR